MKRVSMNLWILILILFSIIFLAVFIIWRSGIMNNNIGENKQSNLEKETTYEDYQLIVVSVTGNTAKVSLMDRDCEGNWGETLSTSGYIGKNGLGKTREGDMKTPIGKYSITEAFGINENPGTILPYTKVDDSYYWVDDSNSRYYNQFVTVNEIAKDWNSAEQITKESIAYKYVLALDYNSSCTPGLGSAIFIHVSKGNITSGCIAIPEDDMVELMKNLKGGCKVVIDYSENIDSYLN